MAAYEVLLLNTAIPQIQAAQSGDTYVVPRDIAINATAIISANSATDALRITQTGAGNALVVEDSANPDSSPFVVTAAGDVGAGTSSPTAGFRLDVVGGDFRVSDVASDDGVEIGWSAGGNHGFVQAYDRNASAFRNLILNAAATIDSSGNLGLGVTPSPWDPIFRVQQIGIGAFVSGRTDTNSQVQVGCNAYYDDVDNRWEYISSGFASRYYQDNSVHVWETAPSWNGTGSNAITFTQAMTLDASGNLLVGRTNSDGYRVAILGATQKTTGLQLTYQSVQAASISVTSTSALAFGVDGADGSTERARITSGGDLQIANGNLVMSTSGKGIDFSATASGSGTMTSELLEDYEEGTFTPSQGAGLTVVGTFSSTGKYTKIGRQVTVLGKLQATTSVSCVAGAIIAGNLPFTVQGEIPLGIITDAVSTVLSGVVGNPTTALVYAMEAQAATTVLYFQMTYFV